MRSRKHLGQIQAIDAMAGLAGTAIGREPRSDASLCLSIFWEDLSETCLRVTHSTDY